MSIDYIVQPLLAAGNSSILIVFWQLIRKFCLTFVVYQSLLQLNVPSLSIFIGHNPYSRDTGFSHLQLQLTNLLKNSLTFFNSASLAFNISVEQDLTIETTIIPISSSKFSRHFLVQDLYSVEYLTLYPPHYTNILFQHQLHLLFLTQWLLSRDHSLRLCT